MRRTDLSLDEEIAEVEGRLAHNRMQLRALTDEARSRISVRNAVPVALVAALAVGFAASRFMRRSQPSPTLVRQAKSARTTRIAGAVASALLPRLLRPLQQLIEQWVSQRMRRHPVH